MRMQRNFQTYSLEKMPIHGSAALQVLVSSFNAVEPGDALRKYLSTYVFREVDRLFVFGLGKAACAMAQAASDEVRITDALVITKHASPLTFEPVTVIEGNHPVPGDQSLRAGLTAKKFISQLRSDDLLLCLISGGGSALMAAPNVPLKDLQKLTSLMLACGARVDEINVLRRHLDQLKGGGLVSYVNSARVVSLILSDVVGDSLEAIASGPTAPDPTTMADALAVLEKYELKNKIPAAIIDSLYETLKPDNPVFDRVQNVKIASNDIALIAAMRQAERDGFQTSIIRTGFQGEAYVLGAEIARIFKESIVTRERPFCLLAGGEATVTLKGGGKGGRNQEFALAAVDVLAGVENVMLISIATDGEDGPTNAAGAVVTGETAQRAESLGMSISDYLSRNDAYTFFDALDDLIRIGPSGTNVNDLVLCFAF